jgi:tetratricopeptide (TPR) repeat protein
VDLASGRVYSQQRIAVAPSKQNASVLGPPEYPSENEVREMALDEARDRVRKMLLSWTEQRKLIFYDDKAYGMKEAYQKLKVNDAPGALQKSLEALAAAKADPGGKPKSMGHASYNVGMCHFILGDYKAAMPFLKAARENDPKHSIYERAEKECLEALKLEEAMRKVDAKTAKVVLEPSQADPPRAAVVDQAKAGNSVEERLQKLEILKKKGLISPQEYEKKKAQIIDEI